MAIDGRAAAPHPEPHPADGRAEDPARPVALRDVAEFDRRYSTPIGQRWWLIALIVAMYIGGMLVLIAVMLPIAGLDGPTERRVFAVFAVATALYTGLLGGLIWRNVARRVRIDRLARAHGLEYSPREALSLFAGTELQRPGQQVATDAVSFRGDEGADESGDVTDFVAATFAPGTGLTVRRVGFLQLRLDRVTPHIVLVNRRSRVLGRGGSRVVGAQRLRLEGDFDRTFSLYCPVGYERDALYIFTPDLMALMLDVAGDCEIELIDGWLVAYVGSQWRLWRPDRFAAMLTLADALGARARRRTRRYQDTRALPGLVDAGGRRLRLRPTAGTVLSVITSIALGVAGIVSWFTA